MKNLIFGIFVAIMAWLLYLTLNDYMLFTCFLYILILVFFAIKKL